MFIDYTHHPSRTSWVVGARNHPCFLCKICLMEFSRHMIVRLEPGSRSARKFWTEAHWRRLDSCPPAPPQCCGAVRSTNCLPCRHASAVCCVPRCRFALRRDAPQALSAHAAPGCRLPLASAGSDRRLLGLLCGYPARDEFRHLLPAGIAANPQLQAFAYRVPRPRLVDTPVGGAGSSTPRSDCHDH